MPDYGLGRLPAHDVRDESYPMALYAPAPRVMPWYKHWRTGSVLDQGAYPHCVGYAWRQLMYSTPVRRKAGPTAPEIYAAAQLVDEWEGEAYDGTSVRAGAKVLQAGNYIGEYVWARDANDVCYWIVERGPVVLGTAWYEAMFDPKPGEPVELGGRIAGGHAYLANGYSLRADGYWLRCTNSWGRDWGDNGRFWMRAADLDRLLREDGEACAAMEAPL